MKKLFALFLTAVSSVSLFADSIAVNSNRFTFDLTLKGGGMSNIVYSDGHGKVALSRPGEISFTEKVFADNGEKALGENFADLNFQLVKDQRTDKKVLDVTLSAGGVAAFDWLRVSKKYIFNYGKTNFTIEYTLTNRSDKAQSAGLWIKSFLRPVDAAGTVVHQPREGQTVQLTHPGNAVSDEWSTKPGASVCSIVGKDNTLGLLYTLNPADTMGYYTWTGNKGGKVISTLEMFVKPREIAANSSIVIPVKVEFSRIANKYAAAYPKNKKYKVAPDAAAAALMEKIKSGKYASPKQPTLAEPGKYAEFTVANQFYPQIRSIKIPAGENVKNPAVYAVYNNRIDRDKPLASKLVKQPDNSYRLFFQLPGIAPEEFYYTKFIDKKCYLWRYNGKIKIYRGDEFVKIRAVLDAPTKAPELKADKNNLYYNGDFEKTNAKNTFADGHFWEQDVLSRNIFFWENGKDSNKSKVIRIKRENNTRFTANFGKYFRAEKGVRYTYSLDMKVDNPNRKYAIGIISFYTNDSKPLNKHRINFSGGNASFDWKRLSRSFTAPEGAAYFSVGVQLDPRGQDNTMWIDNVVVETEDLNYKPASPLEAARKRAVDNGYLALDAVSTIKHTYVTPHEKWFKPSAFKLPKVLYLCMLVNGRNEMSPPRSIVELAQRMDLEYEYIPVLGKGLGLKNPYSFGVLNLPLGNTVEDYTIEKIKAVAEPVKLIIVQEVNFAAIDSNRKFSEQIAELHKKGARTLFLNCKNVPSELLGKKKSITPGLELLPQLNKSADLGRNVKCYEYGSVINLYDCHYFHTRFFPAVPPFKDPGGPAFFSRDFPYWEYYFFVIAKELRNLGVKLPAEFAAAEVRDQNLQLKVNARTRGKYTFKAQFKDLNGFVNKNTAQTFELKTGENTIACALPQLPGGKQIVHYTLGDLSGKSIDAGALYFTTADPEKLNIEFAKSNKIFEDEEAVRFTVKSQSVKAGDKFSVFIEDSFRRIVARQSKAADKNVAFALNTPAPRTILYNMIVEQKRNGKVIARTLQEFSKPSRSLDATAYYAGMWGGQLNLNGILSEMGFDFYTTDLRKNFTWRDAVTLNMRPLAMQGGIIPESPVKKYRDDKPSDPVRTPCFSDPEYQQLVRRELLKALENTRSRYYGGTVHQLGDEMYLGSTICFSEHCLKDFRSELKKSYKNIAALNKIWNRNYTSFDQVMPVQLNEVRNSDNLAPWLDHKMFMSKVFAEKFLGFRRNIIKEAVPGAVVGMSGTQIPGYGYNWAQLMKNIDCTSYYSGIQTTLVNDLGQSHQLAGQWGGGYAGCDTIYESYQRSTHWANLFKGANTSWNWHGSAFNGDGTATENLKAYVEEFNLLKSGIARLLLAADRKNPPVAILYSHSSFFTALAGGIGAVDWQNTQTTWDQLLKDLKCDAKFITYEQLASKDFKLDSFKVIVLPMTLALSQAERENLVRFVEQGGTVLADIYPGAYDEHGKRIYKTELDKLFQSFPKELNCQTLELKKGIWRGNFRVAGPQKNICSVKKYGKGKAILFNIMFNSYQAMTFGGAGGELASAASGTDAYCLALRKAVGDILQSAEITPHARVLDARNQTMPCQSVLKKAGKNCYFGVIRHAESLIPGRIDHKNAPKVTVKLPVSGVIYDVRSGRIVGNGSEFKTTLPLGYGQLFAILPAKVQSIEVTAPAAVTAGSPVRITAQGIGAADDSVYSLQLIDPAGKVQKLYNQNKRFAKNAEFEVFMPYNAVKGPWQIIVKHVASQVKTVKTLNVK